MNTQNQNLRYCTFWYPTIFHENTKVKNQYKKNGIDFKIDDDSEEFPFKGFIFIDDNENITIESNITTKDKGEIELVIKLNLIKPKRNNGFVQYSVHFDENVVSEKEIEQIFVALSKSIYHKIKNFYHSHEADSKKDAALKAVCFEKANEFKKLEDHSYNNKYLIGFLKDFEKMFKASARVISDHNKILQLLLERRSYKSKNLQALKETKKSEALALSDMSGNQLAALVLDTRKIGKFCENVLIEYTYCKTLLTSIYNRHFRHDVKLAELFDINPAELGMDEGKDTDEIIEARKKYRRAALNIRNSVRYVENIRYKNSNRESQILHALLSRVGKKNEKIGELVCNSNALLEDSKKTQKTNTWLGKISVGLGILAFILALPPFLQWVFVHVKNRNIPTVHYSSGDKTSSTITYSYSDKNIQLLAQEYLNKCQDIEPNSAQEKADK